MENPGKIGHKTHHEDKKKKTTIYFIYPMAISTVYFFFLEILCFQTALTLFERNCHTCSLKCQSYFR